MSRTDVPDNNASTPEMAGEELLRRDSIDGSLADNQPFEIQVATRLSRLPPYMFGQINQLLYEKRRGGNDVIDLGMGNRVTPPSPWSSRNWWKRPVIHATTGTAGPTGS